MALDESKLENVRRKGGQLTARCPACAEKGGDRKGEHLIVYEGGGFGCIVYQGNAEHRRLIFALAGGCAGRDKARPKTPVLKKWKIRTIPGWNPLKW